MGMPARPLSDVHHAPDVVALALRLQATFIDGEMSLADPATAKAFRATLTLVEVMIEGAYRMEKVDAGQYALLRGMIQGMQAAPDIV